jgi:hypothetical protein
VGIMAINKNLYEFIGISELSGKRDLKAGYRIFLRKQKKNRSGEESVTYILKKSAWILLQDPKKKAEMDRVIEQSATPSELQRRKSELSRRKMGSACIALSFILAIAPLFLSMIVDLGVATNDGGLIAVMSLMPMAILFLAFPPVRGGSIFITVLPYVIGIIFWALLAMYSSTFDAIGIVIVLLFWIGINIQSNRRGDERWTILN